MYKLAQYAYHLIFLIRCVRNHARDLRVNPFASPNKRHLLHEYNNQGEDWNAPITSYQQPWTCQSPNEDQQYSGQNIPIHT